MKSAKTCWSSASWIQIAIRPCTSARRGMKSPSAIHQANCASCRWDRRLKKGYSVAYFELVGIYSLILLFFSCVWWLSGQAVGGGDLRFGRRQCDDCVQSGGGSATQAHLEGRSEPHHWIWRSASHPAEWPLAHQSRFQRRWRHFHVQGRKPVRLRREFRSCHRAQRARLSENSRAENTDLCGRHARNSVQGFSRRHFGSGLHLEAQWHHSALRSASAVPWQSGGSSLHGGQRQRQSGHPQHHFESRWRVRVHCQDFGRPHFSQDVRLRVRASRSRWRTRGQFSSLRSFALVHIIK